MSRQKPPSFDKISTRKVSLINKQHRSYSSIRALKSSEPGSSTPPKDSSILSSSVPYASPSRTFKTPTGQPTLSATYTWPVPQTSQSGIGSSNSPDVSSSVLTESSTFPVRAPSAHDPAFSQSVLGNATVVVQATNQEMSKGIVLSIVFMSATALVVLLLMITFFFLWRRRRAINWQGFASTKAEYSTDFSKEIKSDVDRNSTNMGNLQFLDVSPDFELQSCTPSYNFSDYWESKCSVIDDRCCQDQSKAHSLYWETSTIASGSTNVYSECDPDAAIKEANKGSTAGISDKILEDNIKQQIKASSASIKPKNSSREDTIYFHADRCTDQWENSTIASLEDFSLADCEKN
jgi:hypothetical protein